MIRFCDKDIYIVNEGSYSRSELFSFFCSENHITDIIGVYNDTGKFKGIITYDRLLDKNIGYEDILQTERVDTSEENIWETIKKIFHSKKSIIFLPVFNEKNELVYFAYDDENNSYQYINMEKVIDQIELMNGGLFIRELFPKVQVVYINDLNEWAFRFYNICLKRNVPVVVLGEKWKEILKIESQDIMCPDCAKMIIYSEGTDMIYEDIDRNNLYRFKMVHNFGFLSEILLVNRIYSQNQIKKHFRDEGKKNILLCRVPGFDELVDFSYEEYYRNRNDVNSYKLFSNDKMVQAQFIKVCGENYKKTKNIQEELKKRWSNIIDEGEYRIARKKYGYGDNYLYILGPCIVDDIQCLTSAEGEKLPNYIQKCLDENLINASYAVISITLPGQMSTQYYDIINSLSLKENDIIICIDESAHIMKKYNLSDDVDIDLSQVFNMRSRDTEWFLDRPIHTTKIANQIIAKWMFDNYIKKAIEIMDFSKEQRWLQKSNRELPLFEIEELEKYIDGIDKFNSANNEKIGAIVMNCNPLTLGHKYLIEYARNNVDYLYIFVVEENRSIFQFEDRINLVRQGVKEWENVKVLPSGRYILSYNTMPIYFEKEQKEEAIIDASEDIELFAKFIAPKLNISVRFAGTEPYDKITMQYNVEMKRTLAEFGIEFIEIPRHKNNGQFISASIVRQKLKDKNWTEISELVPEVTMKFLKDRFS